MKRPKPKPKPVPKPGPPGLDERKALVAISRGATAANVARAAGSRAKTREALAEVGRRLRNRLRLRGEIHEVFDRLGYTVEEFAKGVIEQATSAMRVDRHWGKDGPEEAVDIDFAARAAARYQYLEACGLRTLPYGDEASGARDPLAELNDAELAELVRQAAGG
jgi:hypothetical protein